LDELKFGYPKVCHVCLGKSFLPFVGVINIASGPAALMKLLWSKKKQNSPSAVFRLLSLAVYLLIW
jgi:hypothetical protein